MTRILISLLVGSLFTARLKKSSGGMNAGPPPSDDRYKYARGESPYAEA